MSKSNVSTQLCIIPHLNMSKKYFFPFYQNYLKNFTAFLLMGILNHLSMDDALWPLIGNIRKSTKPITMFLNLQIFANIFKITAINNNNISS